MKALEKIFNWAIDAMAGLSIFLILFITAAIAYQVLIRFFSAGAIIWINDVTEYVLLWITFLGGPYVLREQKHIEVDILVSRLSESKQLLVKSVTSSLGAGICLILSWYALDLVWDFYQRGVPVVKTIEVSKALVIFPIFLGFFFMTILFVLNARVNMLKRKSLSLS